ncbi:MAG: hypothetical protein ABIG40_02120 [Parcubacteria group bacterium]
MFINTPRNPSKLKRVVSLSASTILGVLLSFIAHGLIEINYLQKAESQGQIVPFYGGCTLKPWLQIALFLIGAIGGFLLGLFWWQKVYVERFLAKK